MWAVLGFVAVLSVRSLNSRVKKLAQKTPTTGDLNDVKTQIKVT